MGELRLHASSAPRWCHCFGSPRMEAEAPQGDKTAARAGDVAHEAAHTMLIDLTHNIPVVESKYAHLPSVDFRCAKIYAKIVFGWAQRGAVFAEPYLLLEKTIEQQIIPGIRKVKPDAVIWDRTNLELHIFDLKTGFSPVQAENNFQLLIYAFVMLNFYQISLQDERVSIHLHIIQPKNTLRDNPDDIWTPTPNDLNQNYSRVMHAATEASKPGAMCTPGPHCVYCRGRGSCETFGGLAHSLIELISEPMAANPKKPTIETLAAEANLITTAQTVLGQREAGITMEIEALIQSGQRVPGFEIERKAGREEWCTSDESVANCLKQFGHEPFRIMTPYQVRQEKLIPDNMMRLLTNRRPGKAKLKRVKASAVAKAFEGAKK